jgi:hypothetical protein
MKQFALPLIVYPKAEVYFQRTDRPGLASVKLSTSEVDELRRNPTDFAEKLTIAPIFLDLRDKLKVTATATVNVRVGYSTLADAFGDRIYLRLVYGRFESPIDGRWVESIPGLMCDVPHTISSSNGATVSAPDWVSVATEHLLSLAKDRYYLPRAWNIPGPWVTHEKLSLIYNQYKKEKANV